MDGVSLRRVALLGCPSSPGRHGLEPLSQKVTKFVALDWVVCSGESGKSRLRLNCGRKSSPCPHTALAARDGVDDDDLRRSMVVVELPIAPVSNYRL
jgi:hypothetical protein